MNEVVTVHHLVFGKPDACFGCRPDICGLVQRRMMGDGA